jgi:hypothetical protein
VLAGDPLRSSRPLLDTKPSSVVEQQRIGAGAPGRGQEPARPFAAALGHVRSGKFDQERRVSSPAHGPGLQPHESGQNP